MKINRKLIAYRAIIIIPYVLIFPLACVGWVCRWVVDRYLDFVEWLQTKLLNDK